MTYSNQPYAPFTAEARCQRFFERLQVREDQIRVNAPQSAAPSQALIDTITLGGLSSLME